MSAFEALQVLQSDEAYSEDVARLIEKIKAKLIDTIKILENVDVLSQYQPREGLKRAKLDLKKFSLVCERLPPEFELVVVRKSSISDAKKLRIRENFENYSKKSFLKSIALNPIYNSTLLEMGLSREEIQTLSSGSVPFIGESALRYDVSTDHIIEISLGGDNRDNNLCLVPQHINNLKEEFVTLQEHVLPEETQRLLFSPRDSNQVPLVVGGFRKKIVDLDKGTKKSEYKKRINEFLGIK